MTNRQGTTRPGIDPRGPRFTAGVTALLLLVAVTLALLTPPGAGIGQRATEPGFVLVAVLSALFAWSAFAGVTRGPWSVVFRKLIRPRLAPPSALEESTPPAFAQGVGFVITLAGLTLHLAGVPLALVIAASAAFVAAVLNSVFALCLGCELYLLLARAGLLARKGATAA